MSLTLIFRRTGEQARASAHILLYASMVYALRSNGKTLSRTTC